MPRQQTFNDKVATKITDIVSTMWCAYFFACLAFVSLPQAIMGGKLALITWVSQTFLQLVLLSVIMVGQEVGQRKSDRRAEKTYKDTENILKRLEEHDAKCQECRGGRRRVNRDRGETA